MREEEFFNELNLYESKYKPSLDELWSIPFFLNYVVLEKIFNLANDIRKIEEDYYKGYKLFNNVIKYINNGRFKL